jgi:hypothetical protein
VEDEADSFEVMGRDRGFSPADRRAVIMAAVRGYRDRMRQAAGMGTLGSWYDQLEAGMLLKLVRQEMRVGRLDKRRPAGPSGMWPRHTPATAPGCSPAGG